jgi:5-methyltetrahydrofolate--homocysteine methyltransferase
VEKPDFVMMSALLTMTMAAMRETAAAVQAAGVMGSVKIGVWGAPITQLFADGINADFHTADATGASSNARELVA